MCYGFATKVAGFFLATVGLLVVECNFAFLISLS